MLKVKLENTTTIPYSIVNAIQAMRTCYSSNHLSDTNENYEQLPIKAWENTNREDLHGEVWITINNSDKYMISNLGRVKSLKWNKSSRYKKDSYPIIMKQSLNNKGYCHISIKMNDDKFKAFKVHRLVGLHFIENPMCKSDINHINGDKTFNSVENLEWNTSKENFNHAIKNNLIIINNFEEKNPNSKLKKKDVIYIYSNPYNKTTKELSKSLNITIQNINRIYNREIWENVTKDLVANKILHSERFFKSQNKDLIFYSNSINDVLKKTKQTYGVFKRCLSGNVSRKGWVVCEISRFEYIKYHKEDVYDKKLY